MPSVETREQLAVLETVLEQRARPKPRLGLVLGSGLGSFAAELQDRTVLPYGELPQFPRSTAIGHAGEFVFGRLGDIEVAVMSGRVHQYEGYTPAQVTMGVRLMGLAGIRRIVFTNAAGGINLSYSRGALVLVSDHINLQGTNPLAGPNDPELGTRHPDMSTAYSPALRSIALRVAEEQGLALSEGVYAAMLGPMFETPAEIRFLRTIGADLVGMSTVPEVIAANHMGLEVLAISCVTNMAAGILPQRITHEEVLETGEMVRGTLVRYLQALLPQLEP
jgi:purine-nucleoside phosphorylase